MEDVVRGSVCNGTLAKLWELIAPPGGSRAVEQPHHLRLATCAILLEVALADEEFSEVERALVTKTVCERFSLSLDEGNELIDASMAKRTESADLWHFTREINASCTREEKLGIVEEIWRVVFADQTLHSHEDYLMHKLGKLLNLSHRELIEAKLAAKGR